MNANIMKKTIEMSAKEAKAAGFVGTPEYTKLAILMKQFPTFELSYSEPAKRKTNELKLTDATIKTYIQAHDNANENMKEFYTLIGCDDDGKKNSLVPRCSPGEIKTWFLSKYPEVEAFETFKKRNKILDKAREDRKKILEDRRNNLEESAA